MDIYRKSEGIVRNTLGIIACDESPACCEPNDCAITHCIDVEDWTETKTHTFEIDGPFDPDIDPSCLDPDDTEFGAYHELAIEITAFIPAAPITEPVFAQVPGNNPHALPPPDSGCYYKGPLGDGRWLLVVFFENDGLDDSATYCWYIYEDEEFTIPTTVPRSLFNTSTAVFDDVDAAVFAYSATNRPENADCETDFATFQTLCGDFGGLRPLIGTTTTP